MGLTVIRNFFLNHDQTSGMNLKILTCVYVCMRSRVKKYSYFNRPDEMSYVVVVILASAIML